MNKKENQSLVSIIVPIYNAERYINKCMESILSQTYKNLDIILINDGSNDCSIEICNSYIKKDKRIRLFSQKNEGVSAARNYGIREAKGDYITFIDIDDYIDMRYIEILTKDIEENHVDIVCCNCVEVENQYDGNRSGKFILVDNKRIINNKETYFKDYVEETIFYGTVVWAKLFKKSLFLEIQFKNLNFGEDTLLMIELFKLNPITYLDDYAGYYYVRWENSTTISAGKMNIKRAMNHLLVEKNINEVCINLKNNNLKKISEKRYSQHIYQAILELVQNNDYEKYIENGIFIMNSINEVISSKNIKMKYKFFFESYYISEYLAWKLFKCLFYIKKLLKILNLKRK